MTEENKASPGTGAVRKARVRKNAGTKKSRKRHRPKGPSWKAARSAISNAAGSVMDRIRSANKLKILSENVPYIIIFYIVEKQAWLYRYCTGDSMIQKLMNMFLYFSLAFRNPPQRPPE